MVSTPAMAAAPAASNSPAPAPNGAQQKPKAGPQSGPGTLNGPPSGNNHAIPLSARRAESLDMSTVERRGQPNATPDTPRKARPNGIPDAPVFRPTEEEFKDPMEYMRKIAPEGRKHGIVKIIPPESWNPPFAINTERFHFRTRRQELNSVEGGNRVNNDYLDQLAKFHKTHGHSLNRFPSVDKRPLDLYRLKKTVERKGGFDAVCKGKRWAEVGRDLGYSGKIMSSLSTSLKNSYQKWLLPYEDYLRLAKPGVQHHMEMMNGGPFTPSPGPSPVKKSQANTPVGIKEETPAMRASSALHASINGSTPTASTADAQTAAPPAPSGFTAVNSGFTAVNTSSFTAVNGDAQATTEESTTPAATTPQATGHVSIAPNPNGISALKRQHSDSILSKDEIDALGRRSKRLRRDTPTVAGSNMHHSRMGAARLNKDRGTWKPGEVCEGCGKPGDTAKQIICESCDCAWHMYCLDQPLKQQPEFEWHCPRCLVGTNEYGFEEGDVYSLSAFQIKANDFKSAHFQMLPRQFNPLNDSKHEPNEEDVEREFWRLVDDINDTVEVEYGADIHSTTHGSGFPTIEKQPRDPYSSDPWNLNILPLDKESLFRHIKSDISGMTVPWLYVGMVFSTFCWHNEDHFSYSANYQHFGSTKTWYGIPGEDSNNFENAMREEVPELFEMQPDLLFQLVTLAKPEKLKKAGVRVFAIDQHAGEFVITYPRAYHAGFNHGFNFNEAVNFAPADWEPFGEESMRRLQTYRKQPCFSHDELLLTAAASSYNIRTAKWLAPALERLRGNELAARKYFRTGEGAVTQENTDIEYTGERYKDAAYIIQPQDEAEEDEAICTFCKAYCYLSRLLCRKTGKSVCLWHAGSFECCDAPLTERYSGSNAEHLLCYRMTDEALAGVVRKANEKASIPELWSTKVDAELADNPSPSLRHLRTLLAEGEKIQYDLPQLPDLKRFVDRCNDWVEEATNYITRKQQNRRKNDKVWRKSTSKTADDERDKELRNVDNIRKLLESADLISFECPEITTLRERADSIDEFRRDADAALHNVSSKSLQEFEELVERGKEFHVDMPEIDQLETLLKRLKWNDLARVRRPTAELPQQTLTLNEIDAFIKEGLEIGVPEDNPDIMYFKEQKQQGEMWEVKAQELMSVEHVHFPQLDALSRQAAALPVSAETLARIDTILKKQREMQEKILALYEQTKDPEFRRRPMYREVRDVMASLDDLQSKPSGTIDLEKEQKRHEDWMRRGKKLFGKANAPLHILHQHMQIVEARNEACFDLRDKPRMPVEPSSRANTPDENAPLNDSGSSRDVFCICRRPEAGMMIECELCHEWYHGKCLKIARGKVKEDDKYTCPICDWRVKIPRDAARPKLEDLQVWQDELETLPFQPEEEETLNNIVAHGQAFRDFLRPYVNPISPATPDEIGTLRFHLRKIEGADILLGAETNYLRKELHKWAPVAPQPPPVIEISSSTRKPRPTKQQKIMAQLGITNPEDLPQQYKIKPHIAKRKASEAMGKNMPLQPAGNGSASPVPQGPQPLTTPFGAPKLGLTALAIQVLGPLAGNPVALKMLANEPHMNREKLEKMRRLLADDPKLSDDVDTFSAKMAALPHMPAFGYETNHVPSPGGIPSSSYRDNAGPYSNNGPSQSPAPGGMQQPRLGSPADFTTQHARSPTSPPFRDNMFETAAGTGMFDTPSATDDMKQQQHLTSPDFGANSRALFASPGRDVDVEAIAQAALQSPGLDNSQNAMMDSTFSDLVNDHDGPGSDEVEKQPDVSSSSMAPVIDPALDPALTEMTAPASNVPDMKTEDGDTVMQDASSTATAAATPSAEGEIKPHISSSA